MKIFLCKKITPHENTLSIKCHFSILFSSIKGAGDEPNSKNAITKTQTDKMLGNALKSIVIFGDFNGCLFSVICDLKTLARYSFNEDMDKSKEMRSIGHSWPPKLALFNKELEKLQNSITGINEKEKAIVGSHDKLDSKPSELSALLEFFSPELFEEFKEMREFLPKYIIEVSKKFISDNKPHHETIKAKINLALSADESTTETNKNENQPENEQAAFISVDSISLTPVERKYFHHLHSFREILGRLFKCDENDTLFKEMQPQYNPFFGQIDLIYNWFSSLFQLCEVPIPSYFLNFDLNQFEILSNSFATEFGKIFQSFLSDFQTNVEDLKLYANAKQENIV